MYSSSLKDFAKVDNNLAAAQLAIGESSNLAQLALTYTYNFDDVKYYDAVCILSVLAQVAIDNAKRKFAVDLTNEIKYIKSNLDIDENGLPLFWQITKKDKRKARTDEERRERQKKNKKKIRSKINPELICPMNFIFNVDIGQFKSDEEIVPISDFFISHELDEHRRKCKKVEELIQKYSLELYNTRVYDDEDDNYLLLREDFIELVNDIKMTHLSKNYTGLMSWLINRAFYIGAGIRSKKDVVESTLSKNKPLLMSVLYAVNKDAFLACFKPKVDNE